MAILNIPSKKSSPNRGAGRRRRSEGLFFIIEIAKLLFVFHIRHKRNIQQIPRFQDQLAVTIHLFGQGLRFLTGRHFDGEILTDVLLDGNGEFFHG